tara:strand:- start:4946 stop:10432 length:5487 start_codon:yes stop_codon:yes gene_type:complete
MKDPIKIIHKYKNKNRRNQYLVYIFVGNLISDEIKKILTKIKNLNFTEAMLKISKKNYKIITEYYGFYWYTLFFPSAHLNYSIKNIKSSSSNRRKIIEARGKSWFSDHIEKIPEKKKISSFATNYEAKNIILKKINIKIKNREVDFRTYFDSDMIGGNNKNSTNDIDKEIKKQSEETEEITEDIVEEEVEESFNMEELANLYSMDNIEKEKTILETTKLISEALKDKSWKKKISKPTTILDDADENLVYDSKIENIYKKIYIYDQYIFKNDTIKNIRNKVAVSIPLNDKFKLNQLLPELQYFWSEYKIENKKDKIMLGMKWSRRNELLKIDIIPNDNLAVYENLRNNLVYLRDSFGYKLKREDDETSILRTYQDYISYNEIFMMDILNDLGLNYKKSNDKLKNLFDVYISIYFPLLSYENYLNLINILNIKKNDDNIKILDYWNNMYNVIRNDMILEAEISKTVEKNIIELENDTKFKKLFQPTNINQSIIHVNIRNKKNITGTVSPEKLNLYRIFDNFIVSDKYPFIEYQANDGQITYKFFEKSINNTDKKENLIKWFENAPYGLSFKVKVDNQDKYISIGIMENGRIEYKITWKENDKATTEDIYESYSYIKTLIKKINNENKKVKIMIPEDDKFKFAFINTIQKFNLPKGYKINHNDFSDFCRFFYPYVALVIEPKKRLSKKTNIVKKSSKYGTYLRYKRIDKYENKAKLQMRILWYFKNYDISEKQLIDEISKQFNITAQIAEQEIQQVKLKFSKAISRSGKSSKKMKALPKSKPPGIEITIQGRDVDNYKLRIYGARDKNQLHEIIQFMEVLIYLYSMTYLLKKSKFQKIRETLKKLNKIAKRRNKVVEIVNYESEIKNVKLITAIDKKRLGFKPEDGQNQWTRSCQNSGKDKKRRPNVIQGSSVNQLLKSGYKLNKNSGYYEKEVTVTVKGKKQKVNIRAAKISDADDNNKFNFYTCDPLENGEHTYIGFLSRGNNPNDLCMPCCFKKDHLYSANNKKKNYYLKCLGNKISDSKVEEIKTKDIGDKVYILQDTNKIQEGRFIDLPNSLDRMFNKIWKHDRLIKNHYLYESKSGYFFKYTVKDNYYNFLAAISNIFDKPIDQLKQMMINKLKNDKNNNVFNYLNNGDIRGAFKIKEDFINYIKNSYYLEYEITGELLSLPNMLTSNGIFYYVLEKSSKKLDKINYYLKCLNTENINRIDSNHDSVILLKEDKYYFPIYLLQKNKKISKKMNLTKFYNKDVIKKYENIFDELYKYYSQSCQSNILRKLNNSSVHICKSIIKDLEKNNVKIISQIIDERFKCRFILIDNLLLPVKPSGSDINFPINEDYHNIISKNIQPLEKTIENVIKINKILNKDYIPKNIIYNNQSKTSFNIVSIKLKNGLFLPIKHVSINKSEVDKFKKKHKVLIQYSSVNDRVDLAISNPTDNNDIRRQNVKINDYHNEGFNLFRLELSLYLEKTPDVKNKIISIVRNKEMNKKERKLQIYNILINIVNKKIDKSIKLTLKNKSFAHIVKDYPKLINYVKSNIREYCSSLDKDKCGENPHCFWNNGNCRYMMTIDMAKDYINHVLYEIIRDKIEFKEIIQENDYFVSDIVNYSLYTDRPGQKIIRSNNFNLKKILSKLFGVENIPTIGRRRGQKQIFDETDEYPKLIQLGSQFIQPILNNNNSIIRAFVNGLYWVTNPLYHIESRNLGYKSDMQDKITNIIKAKIVEFILDNKNDTYINKFINENENFFDSTINKFRKNILNSNGLLELYVLSYIFEQPIIVYDNFNRVIDIYHRGKLKISSDNIKKYTHQDLITEAINIKLEFEGNKNNPKNISAVYFN